MATIAEIHLPADEFALSYTLDTIEDVNVEIELPCFPEIR
jgi:hypothetical protein